MGHLSKHVAPLLRLGGPVVPCTLLFVFWVPLQNYQPAKVALIRIWLLGYQARFDHGVFGYPKCGSGIEIGQFSAKHVVG